MKRTFVGMIIGGFIVAPMTYWITDREPPHVRLSGKLIPDRIYPGDTFETHWDIHTNRKCPEYDPGKSVMRWIKDGAGKVIDLEPVEAIAGKQQSSRIEIKRTVRLPLGTTDGPSEYGSVACFSCNWTQRFWFSALCVGKNGPNIPFTTLKERDR